MAFPKRVNLKEMRHRNEAYDCDKIAQYQALYTGGDLFHDNIDSFLRKRRAEQNESKGPNAQTTMGDHYSYRKSNARYINRAGGLIDWLVAAVLHNGPRIVVDGANDVQAEYWESLNSDIDGHGTDLNTQATNILIQSMVHGRGYIDVVFPGTVASAADPESLSGRIREWPASSVVDWGYDDKDLLFIKTHEIDIARNPDNPWMPPVGKKERWRIYTADSIAVYDCLELDDGDSKDDEEFAVLVGEYPHDCGCVPVWPIMAHDGQWVMYRIADPVISLFNREAAMDWHLDMSAYAQPVVTTESPLDQMIAGELMVIKLDRGDSFDYASPDAGIYSTQESSAEYLKKSLYETVQALAINAMATQTQNARQSAAAKEIDRNPLQVLLESFGTPLREAYEHAIAALKRMRNEEDLDVRIVGLDGYESVRDETRELILGDENGEAERGGDGESDADGGYGGGGTEEGTEGDD